MKLTLHFDDEQEARYFLDAPRYRSVLEDLYRQLRSACKHTDNESACKWKEVLCHLVDDAGLDLP